MLRRVSAILVTTAVLAGGAILTAPAASAAEDWRVWARCTQAGIVKVWFAHDAGPAGEERITAEFKAYTAVGQQAWDWKTKINGLLFTRGTTTTGDSGDLPVEVSRAEAGQPAVTSLAFDATNRATGERCRLTVAVPPVGQPYLLDLDPWYAQGYCTQGTPWKLRVKHHVRTNGREKFEIAMKVLDGEPGQEWLLRATTNDLVGPAGNNFTNDQGFVWAATAVIGQPGQTLDLQTAGTWAKNPATGEVCKVDVDVLPLA